MDYIELYAEKDPEDPQDVEPELTEDIKKNRVNYGVSRFDTWSLDCHFAAVLSNGLKMLADNAHAFPGVGDYSDENGGFDRWVADLNKHAANFRKYYELSDRETARHDGYEWPDVDEDSFFKPIEGRKNAVRWSPPEDYSAVLRQWTADNETDRVATMAGLRESLAWISQWWEDLWD